MLTGICEKSIISSLGSLAVNVQCCFSCGGTVPEANGVSLLYKKRSGDWSSRPLLLPADLTDSEHLQEFLDTCSTATFGIGGETVTDKAYRDALKLEPEYFRVDFEVASTTIINDIASIMSIGCSPSSVRAELYKLNIYSTGCHFKAHVDTPRSKDMFGSLVVCLPSQFTGGALVTRHQGRQMTFDWSSSHSATQWAAFYSDVVHEVLPVTSGHRITLTYNLYQTMPLQLNFDVTTNPLYGELLSALQSPHFMRFGGTLGFFCQHKYVETLTDSDSEYGAQLSFLKGADKIVYQVARSLQLGIDLKAICNNKYAIPKFGHRDEDGYSLEEGWCDTVDENELGMLQHVFDANVMTTDDISWCFKSDLHKAPLLSTVYYGNDANPQAFYQSAALLVKVPVFSTSRGSDSHQTSPIALAQTRLRFKTIPPGQLCAIK